MTAQNQNAILLSFTHESMVEIEELAIKLNTNKSGVISQALSLLRLAQGRKVVLQDSSRSVEIKNYISQPAIALKSKW